MHGIKAEPIPARRHKKIAIESKHGILRSIFNRLREANPECRFSLLVARMFSISNMVYGNGIVSAFEAAKGLNKLIIAGGLLLLFRLASLRHKTKS